MDKTTNMQSRLDWMELDGKDTRFISGRIQNMQEMSKKKEENAVSVVNLDLLMKKLFEKDGES